MRFSPPKFPIRLTDGEQHESMSYLEVSQVKRKGELTLSDEIRLMNSSDGVPRCLMMTLSWWMSGEGARGCY